MNKVLSLLVAPVALLTLACGGASKEYTPQIKAQVASSLQYTNPTPKAGEWALVQDASSTPAHLVLNLVGPKGPLYRGVGFTLQAASTKVKFAALDPTSTYSPYAKNGSILQDMAADGVTPIAPLCATSGVKGDKLLVGIFQSGDDYAIQKTGGSTPKDCSTGPVLQIALDLNQLLETEPGPVPLVVTKAQVIPSDISSYQKRRMANIAVAVGTLVAK